MTVPAIPCSSRDEVYQKGVGAFWINRTNGADRNRFIVWLPNDTIPCDLALAPRSEDEHPFWTLTGPDDKPTLSPSINAIGIWHGWLKDGVFVS